MADLIKYQAKKCLTAAGLLIQNERVLLVKHRKLNRWLCPGGHIDPQELPHHAAEREFFEEAGVKVKAVDYLFKGQSKNDQFVPSPIETNLHWVSRENYEARIKNDDQDKRVRTKLWPKGCEQHLNFLYLVKPVGEISLNPSQREVTDIAWFDQDQLEAEVADPVIKEQFYHGLEIISQFRNSPFYISLVAK